MFHGLADGGQEFRPGGALEQVRGPANPERLGGQVRVFVHRDEHQFDAAVELFDLARGFQPVQQRHGQIEHHDVGVMFADGVHERAAVGDSRDDVAFGRQQLFKRFGQ